MAEFCKQCAELTFGPGTPSDFVGLAPVGLATLVLCEGCGHIQVDHHGACISDDCFECHGLNNPWKSWLDIGQYNYPIQLEVSECSPTC